ncbi:MAG: radical SAM family heme chaperone HemW [Planctomycetes bacterium]|nr:radical SAM family heme chaperone HemW [Planctomycetota bacterium]
MKSSHSNLGLYIHIPYCQKKCPYCAFYSEPIAQHKPESLVDALFMELERYAITEPLETIYIGGGSPSCLPGYLLVEMVVSLMSQYDVAEFTIECNPAQVNEATLRQLRALGVNRLSIGAQSFNANELKTLGRIHSPRQIVEAVRIAKKAGFENIGLDLMFGIPGSSLKTWRHSLKSAAALKVQHISAYSLTIEKATPFECAVKQGQLAIMDEAVERQMCKTARLFLRKAGFGQYEISNFAKPGFECRHNLRYWQNLPVIGIGPAAASWYRGKRTTNIADIKKYIKRIESGRSTQSEAYIPSPEQTASESAVLGLRMIEGINMLEYKKQTGFNLTRLFGDAIKQHSFNGLLECTVDDHCRLTEKGLSYADTVAQDFVL